MAIINDCYTRLRGQGLLKAIDKEYSGDIKKLLEFELEDLWILQDISQKELGKDIKV